MKVTIYLYSLLFFYLSGAAQEILTLQQCLETGKKYNLDFQLRQLDIASADAVQRSPMAEYLPKIDFATSHNYSIGSTIDPATNNRVSSNIQTDNFSLNASISLLDLNIFTVARRNKISLLKAYADKEATATEYSLTIMESYFNALYTQELLRIQLHQFENAALNLKRIDKEVTIGSKPKSDLYDMQVSYALEENTIIETRQLLYNRKLILIQLMNIQNLSPDAIVLEVTESDTVFAKTDASLYESAMKNYPVIQASQLAADIAAKEVIMQKNKYLPVLNAYYSYSSFYYLPLNGMGASSVNPFWAQINDNKNHYVGLQLSIPVFNGLRTSRDVNVARIERQKRSIEAEQEKIKLHRLIEQDISNLRQTREVVTKLADTKERALKSFTAAQAKFTNGLIEAVVFTTSKNQMLTAEYNFLNAKYKATYLSLKLKFLEFNKI